VLCCGSFAVHLQVDIQRCPTGAKGQASTAILRGHRVSGKIISVRLRLFEVIVAFLGVTSFHSAHYITRPFQDGSEEDRIRFWRRLFAQRLQHHFHDLVILLGGAHAALRRTARTRKNSVAEYVHYSNRMYQGNRAASRCYVRQSCRALPKGIGAQMSVVFANVRPRLRRHVARKNFAQSRSRSVRKAHQRVRNVADQAEKARRIIVVRETSPKVPMVRKTRRAIAGLETKNGPFSEPYLHSVSKHPTCFPRKRATLCWFRAAFHAICDMFINSIILPRTQLRGRQAVLFASL